MRPGPKPKRKEVIWSPKLAYAVGLIATDGNLSKSGRHIELTSKDTDQLETFLRCVDRCDVPISTKSGQYRKNITRIQFGDVVLYQFLLSIGLTQRKTKTLGPLDIPHKYFADFVRGVFDGDGCSYSYYDSVYPKSFRFYVSFASASPKFLVWLRQELAKDIGIIGAIDSSRSRRCEQLKYSKHEATKLVRYMYYRHDITCLPRKHLKIQETLSIIDRSRSGEIGKHATFRS